MIYLFLILSILLLTRKKKSEYWNGPEPTLPQRQDNHQFLIEYFQAYPNSPIRSQYPHLYNVACATKEYKVLCALKDSGIIDEIEFQIELSKILPLIDIREDIKFTKPQRISK